MEAAQEEEGMAMGIMAGGIEGEQETGSSKYVRHSMKHVMCVHAVVHPSPPASVTVCVTD